MTARAHPGDRFQSGRSISGDATSLSDGPDEIDRPLDSFARVYEKYADFVWFTLQRLGVRESDREDLCHDVFVLAYKKLPGYTERDAVRRWLFAIAVRLASNYRRKAYLHLERGGDALEADGGHSRVPEHAWPEAATARRETFERVRAILERMQPIGRVVFVMFEIEGLSSEAIATELGVPLGTVYSRLHAARKLFRSEVKRANKRGKGAER